MDVPVGTTRVVFLVENAMNTFYAVGGADHIVRHRRHLAARRSRRPSSPPSMPTTPRRRASPPTDGAVDLESLAATDPDLVVLWSADIDDRDTAAIEDSLGVPVYGVFLDSFDDLTKLTADMAAILGDPARGDEVIRPDRGRDGEDHGHLLAIPAEERPSVYWMWGDVFGTAGTQSTANELIEAAGGVNVLADWDDEAAATEHPVLSMETIAQLDPDVIYLWFNPEIDPQDILDGAQVAGVDFAPWASLTAVKEGNVFELDDPFLYDFMTGRQPIATLKIAKDINPEAFADVDLSAEYDAFFRPMYGVTYPDYQPAG